MVIPPALVEPQQFRPPLLESLWPDQPVDRLPYLRQYQISTLADSVVMRHISLVAGMPVTVAQQATLL